MLRRAFRALALACGLAAAPIAASAACLTCYPAATTPLAGSEVVVGSQAGATVDLGVDDIAKRSQAIANIYAATQTFPDGGTWGASGIAGANGVGLAATTKVTWATAAFGVNATGGAGSAFVSFKEGSVTYMQLAEVSGLPSLTLSGNGGASGEAGYCANSGCIWYDSGSQTWRVGNTNYDDETQSLAAKNLTAITKVIMPDDGVGGVIDQIGTTAANFGGQQLFVGGGTVLPTGFSSLWSGGGTIGGSFNAGATGLTIQGGAGAGPLYISPLSSYPMSWDVEMFNHAGFQVAGVEDSQRDQQMFQIGAVRFCSVSLNCMAQLFLTDGMAQGAITGFNTLIGGSSYTNGTYTDVPLTGGAGVLGKADITVAGGAVTAVVLHSPARGGAGYAAGNTLSAAAANIGGTGSGFTVNVASVTSGINGSPSIVLAGTDGDYIGIGGSGPTAAHPTGERYLRIGGITDSGNEGGGIWSFTTADAFNLETAGGLVLANISGAAWNRRVEVLADPSVAGMAAVAAPAAPGTLGALQPLETSFERHTAYTVASLTAADSSPADGDSAYITDATSCTFNSAVAGSGSTHCPVHYDSSSSSWKAG